MIDAEADGRGMVVTLRMKFPRSSRPFSLLSPVKPQRMQEIRLRLTYRSIWSNYRGQADKM